jgi:NADH-quinone oxidoreductase subunit L
MSTGAVLAVLAVLVPILGGPLCYVVERISSTARTVYAVTLGFVTGGLTLSLLHYIAQGDAESFLWIPGVDISVGITLDSLSVFVAIVAGCVGALALLYSTRYMKPAEGEYSLSRYYWQVLLFIGGMIGLALTSNLLIMYVFWEIIGFCSYALISYYYRDPEAVPSGTKAFIVTRIGDIGFLTGVLALWHATGTLNIFEIIDAAAAGSIPNLYLGLAGAGFVAGAVGKSAQFPLHVWLPDAMVAPTTISSLIHAACLVNAGVYLLARSFPVFVGLDWWPTVVMWIGAITAFLAATIALMQWDIKRVLAYSTISQLGYMMAAIGAGALLASQFHLVSHGVFKALLFLCAGAIIHETGTKDMRQMGGLARDMKITHLCSIYGLMSLVGIPVFAGWFSKDMILEDMIHEGTYGPLVLLIMGAFLTAAYSWRMYWLTFRGDRRMGAVVHEAPWQMTGPLLMLAEGSAALWFITSPYTSSMARSLPQYPVNHIALEELARDAFSTPVVWITLSILVVIAILTLRWRAGVINAFREPSRITLLPMRAYWFDTFYSRVIVRGLLGFWGMFRKVQTGDLNYNNLGIAVGFVIVFVLVFVWGI